MKWNWTILMYGLALGLLLVSLEFLQYRWMILDHASELYAGVVAVLFTAVGIWAGMQLTRKKPGPEPASVRPETPFEADPKLLERLGITPRELEVLQWIAHGLSNQEIAERMFVSLNTVKTHTSNVFSKLDVQRRTQAVQKAKDLGLLP